MSNHLESRVLPSSSDAVWTVCLNVLASSVVLSHRTHQFFALLVRTANALILCAVFVEVVALKQSLNVLLFKHLFIVGNSLCVILIRFIHMRQVKTIFRCVRYERSLQLFTS